MPSEDRLTITLRAKRLELHETEEGHEHAVRFETSAVCQVNGKDVPLAGGSLSVRTEDPLGIQPGELFEITLRRLPRSARFVSRQRG